MDGSSIRQSPVRKIKGEFFLFFISGEVYCILLGSGRAKYIYNSKGLFHTIDSHKCEYLQMIDDRGQLSIDFLIGFSIFMITIIATATFASGLLVGLQSKTVDYDAVAYRTGVILAEDPGQPSAFPGTLVLDRSDQWEFIGKSQKDIVLRFGLSNAKSAPGVVSPKKLESFDNFSIYDSPADYQTRMIFGTYPYHYNVTVSRLDGTVLSQIGEPYDYYSTYGRIRRVMMVKEPGVASFNASYYNASQFNLSSDGLFLVYINSPELLDKRGPTYWIDPMKDELIINLTDLQSVAKNGENVTLSGVGYSPYLGGFTTTIPFPVQFIETDKGVFSTQPIDSYVRLNISPGFFIGIPSNLILLTFNFGSTANLSSSYPAEFAHPLHGPPPRPVLVPAIMEVRVW